ncbi:MAG: hypothetical protein JXB06_14905 [Spirochaetales bacterium]|nr:hypothetical protein [Spirochaetales bacterium]
MEEIKPWLVSLLRIAAVIAVVCTGVLTILASSNRPSPFALTIAWTGPAQHVQTGSTVTLDGRGSDFVDSDRVDDSKRMSYMWKFISKPAGSAADVFGSFAMAPSFVVDLDGEYVIELSTRLSSEPESTDTIRVVASSGNSAPVAEAGPHQEVKPGTLVHLDGTASSDADGDTLSYSWSFDADSPTTILSDDQSPTPSFTAAEGEYRLRLEVNDGTETSREDFVTVRASSGNSRPIAIAGADQEVASGTPVTLDGSGSSDADADELTYSWRIISSSVTGASITNPTDESATLHLDSEGICLVQLRVYDGTDWNLRLRDDTNLDRLVVRADDGSSGEEPFALTLQTSLPFTPGEEEAIQIQIDAEGADTIRVISASSPDAYTSNTVLQGNLNMSAGDEANFYTVNSDWSIASRSHDNPVADTESATFVVQRTSDGTYYRIDLDFTGAPATSTLTVDALSAWRCGSEQGDCP